MPIIVHKLFIPGNSELFGRKKGAYSVGLLFILGNVTFWKISFEMLCKMKIEIIVLDKTNSQH